MGVFPVEETEQNLRSQATRVVWGKTGRGDWQNIRGPRRSEMQDSLFNDRFQEDTTQVSCLWLISGPPVFSKRLKAV